MENNLPKGWVVLPLEECCDILDSMRVPINSDERAKRTGDIPYYGATGQVGFINDFLFNEELVLIGEDGAPFFDKSKKIAYRITGKSWVNNHAHVLRAKSSTSNKFLEYFLCNFNYIGYVNGTTRLKLNQGMLKTIPFLLPPLPEQHRIVSKLDTLFEKIKLIRKRLLRIEQIEYEIFLKNILDGQDFYETILLGDFCEEQRLVIGNQWKNVRLIGVSKESGVIDLRVGGKNSFERYKVVKPGWFLYNPMRVDIGSIAIWDGNEIAITSPDYVVFSIKQDLSPLFLLKFLKSNYGLSEINNNTQGAVRSRLYYRNLARIRVPYSGERNNGEAQRILQGFNNYNHKKASLERLLDRLKQSILSKAFHGELVPQDPDEEAANVL